MALSDGDEFVSGSIYSFQQANRMKNHWVRSDPTNVANLSAPQPGMIVVDEDAPYRLWVRTSAPAWSEIIHGDPAVGVSFFSGAGAAENPYARIYGYITAGAAARYVELLVDDTTDEALIQAENNANLDGITVSLPNAVQKFRMRNGAAEMYAIDNNAIIEYSPYDYAGAPVAPTGPMKFFAHNQSLDDTEVVTCPSITSHAFGIAIIGDAAEYGTFLVDSDGDVTLIDNSANTVANADTDDKFCIGTAGAQEPLQIKNHLGGTYVASILLWYD